MGAPCLSFLSLFARLLLLLLLLAALFPTAPPLASWLPPFQVINFGNLNTPDIVCEVVEGDITGVEVQYLDAMGQRCEGLTDERIILRELPVEVGEGGGGAATGGGGRTEASTGCAHLHCCAPLG